VFYTPLVSPDDVVRIVAPLALHLPTPEVITI
jgi:hypothetical protein